jgi:signal transduction histidine kinase
VSVTVRPGDALLGAALFAACAAEALITGTDGPLGLNLVALAVLALPLAVRRTMPLLAATGAYAGALVMNLWLTSFDESIMPFATVLVTTYVVGRFAAGRRGVVAAASGLLVCLGVILHEPGIDPFPLLLMAFAFGLGRAVAQRSRLAAELHETLAQAQETREAEAVQAVADERRRIARELHDIVAHSVSVMVVQAGGARRIVDQDPGRAVEAARRIAGVGDEALREMGRLLGVLQAEPAPSPEASGVDGLRRLAERARGAGVPVTLRVEGRRSATTDDVERAVYRVVQEALTNVLRHAPGAATEVVVTFGADELELRVVNDAGRGDEDPVGERERRADDGLRGAGRGVEGMAERVRLAGGELHAGERAGGGFEVRARLPLAERELEAV